MLSILSQVNKSVKNSNNQTLTTLEKQVGMELFPLYHGRIPKKKKTRLQVIWVASTTSRSSKAPGGMPGWWPFDVWPGVGGPRRFRSFFLGGG